jgi:hypothetical protein
MLKLLPDDSGRVRIHWFERTPDGPITTTEASVPAARGSVKVEGITGRIACMPRVDTIGPKQDARQTIHLVPHSDDPRAVTCPECLATPSCKKMLEEYGLTVESPAPVSSRQPPSSASART